MIGSAIVLSHTTAANAMLIHSISWAWSDFLHFIVMVVASYFCHKEKKANSAACGTRATSHCPCLNSCTGASLWFLTFHSHLHHLPQISILLSRLSGPFSDCLPISSHTFPMDFFFFFNVCFCPVPAHLLQTRMALYHFCVRSWKCNNEEKQKWSTNTRGFELPAEKPQTRRLVLSLEREKK